MSPINLRWIAILWAWFALASIVAVWRLPEWVLPATQLPCFFASGVPFFRGRVGLFRWGLFALWIPAFAMCVVIQCLRSVLHLS